MSEYTRTSPGLTQRVVLFFMRKRAAEIEASTKEWIIICPNCGLERTLWDIGGVRYKHHRRGNQEGFRMRCPRCNERGGHVMQHRAQAGVAAGSAGSAA